VPRPARGQGGKAWGPQKKGRGGIPPRLEDPTDANPDVGDARGLGLSMLRTYVREPVRIVYLARIVLGLLAKDPATLPRVVAQDGGVAFGVKGNPTREDVAVLAAA